MGWETVTVTGTYGGGGGSGGWTPPGTGGGTYTPPPQTGTGNTGIGGGGGGDVVASTGTWILDKFWDLIKHLNDASDAAHKEVNDHFDPSKVDGHFKWVTPQGETWEYFHTNDGQGFIDEDPQNRNGFESRTYRASDGTLFIDNGDGWHAYQTT